MNRDEVIFGIGNERYPYRFNRSYLRLGSIIHVRFDSNGKPIVFSTSPSAETEPFCITWISPSEWYVVLRNGVRISSQAAHSVVKAVAPLLEPQVVQEALQLASDNLRLEHLYKSSEMENSTLSIVQTVADRLDLHDRLQAEPVRDELFSHHLPLSVYLLLTCFDRLGQPTQWLSFEDWLKANEVASERSLAVTQAKSCEGLIEKVSLLVDKYNERYGFRRSFFRFIDEVIPKEQQDKLLASIKIDTLNNPPNLGKPKQASDVEKKKYLFKLRNDYTHRSFVRVWAQAYPWLSDDRVVNSWFQQEQVFETACWKSVATKNWPDVLKETVQIGLCSYLRNIVTDASNSSQTGPSVPKTCWQLLQSRFN